LSVFRPVRNCFQLKADLLCGQGWHDFNYYVPPQTARWRRG
jgi:hypothetical protein